MSKSDIITLLFTCLASVGGWYLADWRIKRRKAREAAKSKP